MLAHLTIQYQKIPFVIIFSHQKNLLSVGKLCDTVHKGAREGFIHNAYAKVEKPQKSNKAYLENGK